MFNVGESSSSHGNKGGFTDNQGKSSGKVYVIKLEDDAAPKTPKMENNVLWKLFTVSKPSKCAI